jgi:hypothetical protein
MYFPHFIGQIQPLPQNCFRALVIQADALISSASWLKSRCIDAASGRDRDGDASAAATPVVPVLDFGSPLCRPGQMLKT